MLLWVLPAVLEACQSVTVHELVTAAVRAQQAGGLFSASGEEHYNRLPGAAYEYIRNFLILHYFANCRSDSPCWRRCAAMAVPESPASWPDLASAAGFTEANELFTEVGWLQVMWGQGIEPEAWHHWIFIAEALMLPP